MWVDLKDLIGLFFKTWYGTNIWVKHGTDWRGYGSSVEHATPGEEVIGSIPTVVVQC